VRLSRTAVAYPADEVQRFLRALEVQAACGPRARKAG
jgi:hypothetical protein